MSPRGRPSRAEVYARFEAAANDLNRLGGLPSPSEAAGIWDDIWHLEAHNSTALEGNTLILREVQVLLDTGRAVGAKELKDYLEVTGYADAAKWVYTQAHTAHDWDSAGLITVTEIRHIHTVAMGPVWDVAPHPEADPQEGPGSFRRHDINPFGGGMTPPPWTRSPANSMAGSTPPSNSAQHHERPAPCPSTSFRYAWPDCTARSKPSTPFSTATAASVGSCSTCCWSGSAGPRRSSSNGPATATSTPSTAPTTATTVRSPNSSPDPFWTTCNDSSSPTSPDQPAWSPCSPWPAPTISYPALRQAATRGRLEAEIGSDGLWRSNQRAVDTYLAGRHRREPNH